MPVSALTRLLSSARSRLTHALYRSKQSLAYDLAQHPCGSPALPLFGEAYRAERLINEYFGDSGPAPIARIPGIITAGRIRQLARAHGMVVYHNGQVPPSLRSQLLQLPRFVGMTCELAPTIEQTRASLSGHLRTILRKIARHGFRLEISSDRVLLAEFHAHFYQPSIRNRHGRYAGIAPLTHMESIMDREPVEFISLHEGKRRIAMMFTSITPEGYRFHQIGWLDGDPSILKTGAPTLLYWHMIERAHQLGLRHINLGGTPACLENGLFHYKSQWGSRVTNSTVDYGTWLLLIDPAHPDLRRYLERCSLIFHGPGDSFYVISARLPDDVATAPRQAGRLAMWYRLRTAPTTAPTSTATSRDLPPNLQPWFDAIPLECGNAHG